MRRTTTAWIAGTLGAGLTASIVLAQQSPPPGSSRAGAADSSATGSERDPLDLRGLRRARGRYLMRNGLDYLNYQQFERALKFLRDAEARQKELTDPERLMLKQGIEARPGRTASRGRRGIPLRAERAVAPSERIHRRPPGNRRRAAVHPGRQAGSNLWTAGPSEPPAEQRRSPGRADPPGEHRSAGPGASDDADSCRTGR